MLNGEIKQQAQHVWDQNSRLLPEDGYDISELNWVIGNDIMLKKDFIDALDEYTNFVVKKTTESILKIAIHTAADRALIHLSSPLYNMKSTIFEDSDDYTYAIDKESILDLEKELLDKIYSNEKDQTS